MIINFICGALMAFADSVPGVSGGTVAFLLGFYDDFINSLDGIFSKDNKKRISGFKFLAKLGVGWVIGFAFAVTILAGIFQTKIYEVSSLFIGFILFAIPVVIYEEKQNMPVNLSNIISLILGILVVVTITILNPVKSSAGMDINNLNVFLVIYIFIAGMISISAMVLPGISGSTMLLIFGLYLPIITGIKEILHFNFTYLVPVAILFLGILTGIVSIVKLIKRALIRFRPQSLYAIIGLMIGSIYTIIMGPTSLSLDNVPLNFSNFGFIWFIVGGVVIIGLQMFKVYTDKKEK